MEKIDTKKLELAVAGGYILFGEKELKHRLPDIPYGDFCAPIADLLKKYVEIGTQKAFFAVLSPEERELALKAMQEGTFLSSFDTNLNFLSEYASRNRIIDKITELYFSFDPNIFTPETLEKISAGERQKRGGFIIEDYMKEYESKLGEPRHSITTGYSFIDEKLGGIVIPSVVCVGARPSTGKTAFALNTGFNAACSGYSTLLFSLEMTTEQILDRMVSSVGNIPYDVFLKRKNGLPYETQVAARTTLKKIRSKNFVIDDKTNTIEGMSILINRLQPKLVIIDYIQIVKSERRFDSIKAQIDYVMSESKRIAKQNNCTIMILSQIQRAGAMAEDKAPTMASLKESGAIEEASDMVMILHRPYVLNKSKPPEETYLLVDKNKFGLCGKANLYFDGKHQRITELSER